MKSEELGFRRYSSFRELTKQLVEVGRVKSLVKIHFSQSDHLTILRKLESLVYNRFIQKWLSSFLSLPILKKDGTFSRSIGIPPVGMISTVLLNLVLDNFDQEFLSSFPNLPYFRYLDEAYVALTFERNEGEVLNKDSGEGGILARLKGEEIDDEEDDDLE